MNKTKSPFLDLLDDDFLMNTAGGTIFDRGESYFEQGLVTSLIEYEGVITAKVFGTDPYKVRFWIEDDEIESSCSCPMGQEGAFCKHCVAAGLAWLHKDVIDIEEVSEPVDDVGKWLGSQDKDVLVKIILESAMDDERLFRKLSLKALESTPAKVNTAAYKQAISQAVHVHDFIHYRQVFEYVSGVEDVIDSIEELLKEDCVEQVVELTEYALDALEEAMGSVDDSNGQVGGILNEVQGIHHRACQKANLDPEELAERLFKWEVKSGYDVFYDAVGIYGDILGEKGTAMYRKLAEEEWAKVQFLTPESDTADKYGKRYRITRIMERFAKRSKDLDVIIDVKKRDLSAAWNYLQIAEACKEFGEIELAIEWVEKGITAFPDHRDFRLQDFLLDTFLQQKRFEEAIELSWVGFSENPNLDEYRKLEKCASQIGCWPTCRQKALELLREHTRKKKEQPRSSFYRTRKADHSALTRIFLWEGDVESAWKEASEGGCNDSLWMELADKRKKSHPEEVIPIYERVVEKAINGKNNESYKEAVRFLKVIEQLMKRAGCDSRFPNYLQSVRVAHKPKRNLIKLLQREWPE